MDDGYPENFESWPQDARNAYFADAARMWRGRKAAREEANGVAAIPSGDRRSEGRDGYVPAYEHGLVTLTGSELLQKEFPPRGMILAPWLPEKGLGMIFAERGVGKTWIAINIAYAVACGGSFLRWRAPKPSRVVYIDGEMPASLLQQRFATVVENAEAEPLEDNFRLVAADMQRDGLPDLADPLVQRFYDDVIRDADLALARRAARPARMRRHLDGSRSACRCGDAGRSRAEALDHRVGEAACARGRLDVATLLSNNKIGRAHV